MTVSAAAGRLAAAALAAALLSGCTATGDPSPTGRSAPSQATRESPPAVPTGLHYAALGDSYSAGPLIPVVRPDPLGCGRSTHNYPALLARRLDVATFTDVTCSGAATRHLRAPQRVLLGEVAPPQLDALTPRTDLVTIGLGGNDSGLFGTLVGTCPRLRAVDPRGAPCRAELTDAAGVDRAARAARAVAPRLARGLRQVARRAPDAEVLVVGYPRLLPPSGTCRAVPFAAGDYAWADGVQRLLNRSLRRAAAATGATYVDTYGPSLGHDACAGRDAWVSGRRSVAGRAAAYHPLQRGMRGVAEVVHDVVASRPSLGGTGG